RVLHLHFPDGELIRTTPEHPFWVEGQSWTQAGALKEGDRIATLSGEWVPLTEVYDTDQWEPVYNVRVADWHTYFVGDEGWGWAAWAHNIYFQGSLETCVQRLLVTRYGWKQADADKIYDLGQEADVHGDVLLEYTEWWIKRNRASFKNIIEGTDDVVQTKIDQFTSQKGIADLRKQLRLRGVLAGQTSLPQPSQVRANLQNLNAQTLQSIIDDIFMYAFRGDPWKDGQCPLALTIATNGRIVLSQAGGGVDQRALTRARDYFGNAVEVTTKNQQPLAVEDDPTQPTLFGPAERRVKSGNIHAEEAAISLLGRTDAQGAKQVCTWYACKECRDLQIEYGVNNLTGYASSHNGVYARW
ncbi:MAG: HINT domain-containing protein, partial [Gemmataceae bacterium]|nr:HINT domain-containing protein [Gemmataceae bacterium]